MAIRHPSHDTVFHRVDPQSHTQCAGLMRVILHRTSSKSVALGNTISGRLKRYVNEVSKRKKKMESGEERNKQRLARPVYVETQDHRNP